MWVFLNNAFLSIVEERGNPGDLRVRARLRGDIERTFPGADVFEPAVSDYRFHAVVNRTRVEKVLASAVRDIDYPDFKSSVPDKTRKATYSRVWSVMNQAQGEAALAERHGNSRSGTACDDQWLDEDAG